MAGRLGGTNIRVSLELQNLTELDTRVFDRSHLDISMAGLAYESRIIKRPQRTAAIMTKGLLENEYTIYGPIVDFRILRNRLSGGDILVADVDVGSMNLEILINLEDLGGELKKGAMLRSKIWLQGYVMDERLLSIRYEGLDKETTLAQQWALFKREN